MNIKELIYRTRLNRYKEELKSATIQTQLQYDAMNKHYDKDSQEFKDAQEAKKKALKELQDKVTEVDKELKNTNSSYLAVWKKRHETVGTELVGLKTKIDDGFTKNTHGFENFVTKVGEGITQLKGEINTLETKEKALINPTSIYRYSIS